ncbi:MAG: hypothetical protein DMF76_04070 [Acidobacteria bacterium]|nr:MAG: hypothetical protein DMF76_04070 [Acidobacteriota bacterium]
MFDVQHFVEHDVFNEPLGDFPRIQCLANRNRIVGRVVMAKDTAGSSLRPGQDRFRDRIFKATSVEPRKNSFQIVYLATG